jgi:alpha/beta hydrolase fold
MVLGRVVENKDARLIMAVKHSERVQALIVQNGNAYEEGRSNLPQYPQWQAYFRKYQPPTLIVWGKNDQIFPAEGADPYKRALKNIEFHLLETGHFALEEDGDTIAAYTREFLNKNFSRRSEEQLPKDSKD